jgi:RimJ/RimL family protein N-acetyltransferase
MASAFELKVFPDLKAFETAVAPTLELKEAENSLMLGLMTALQARPPEAEMLFASVTDRSETVMTAFFTGHLLLLSKGGRQGIDMLVEHFANSGWKCPGIVGHERTAQTFANKWITTAKCKVSALKRHRIYELTKVTPPQDVEGHMRLATRDDLELLLDWTRLFNQEALPHQPFNLEGTRRNLGFRIDEQRTFVWECGGRVVSMAALNRPTRRSFSVGPVFTPENERRHGFASALTAAVSQQGLDTGKEMTVLYTDLDNPVSNSIYMKIGYRPVADARNYWFVY